MAVYNQKEAKRNFEEIMYYKAGFNQDGLVINSFDIQGFDKKGFSIDVVNRKKKLIECNGNVGQAVRKNPRNTFFANEHCIILIKK